MAFGFERKKTDEALSHWFTVPEGFSCPTEEFYSEIEKELKTRKVPGLTVTRVEFAEGGVLSDKRVYLRMIRERLVFDVCAAQFGSYFFFSVRFAEIPIKIAFWEIAVCFIALGLGAKALGSQIGLVATAAVFVGLFWILRNAISLGLEDLDATLIRWPVVGPIYERYFRAETYYRKDTRLIYQKVISEIVKAKVEEVTAAKGVTLLRAHEFNPILEGLYKPVTIHSGVV